MVLVDNTQIKVKTRMTNMMTVMTEFAQLDLFRKRMVLVKNRLLMRKKMLRQKKIHLAQKGNIMMLLLKCVRFYRVVQIRLLI